MCSHLIGKRYEFGSNGHTVDCISMVIQALDYMEIRNPGLKPGWYGMSPFGICRELNQYTDRIKQPTYDGDVVLITGDPVAFGVVWQQGILYINRLAMAVDWKPISSVSTRRSYRMKKT